MSGISPNLIKCIKIFLFITNKAENDSIYLETGLGQGISITDIYNNFKFKEIISIELDKQKIDKVKPKVKDKNNISIIHGDSAFKLKEIYNRNINILFLDAHGIYPGIAQDKISPLENEIKFVTEDISDDQLIIIDDFIKIKNSFLFKNKFDWRSHLKFSKFKQLIHGKGFQTLEIFYGNGNNSYYLLTKNKKFKITKKLFFINLIYRFLTIKFYIRYLKFWILAFIKKIIISLFSENFFLKIKKFIIKK